MSSSLLHAHGLVYRQQGRVLIDHISLSMNAGEIVSIIGPNGAGKTTLVRLLLGLLKADDGSIERAPGLRIGYMPQRFHVDPNLPLPVSHLMRLASRDQHAITRALQRTQALALHDTPLQKLSGGEFQRVLLARALLRQPNLLVLDEPAQGVDIKGQAAFYRLIAELRDELGCGVLLVSHDLHLVMASSDRVICLNQHICCEGHPDAVSTNPAYLELFGEPALEGLGVYTHHHDHHHNLHGDAIPEHDHSRCSHS
ncbi:MAG: zinc ABC transporter ATP-binding protein ZnuC [Gammaproteobacteria bacterium]|nr:MAG: zinc ABC transporter ATP-binding protein ZnuC [Gammaproteobacteria bacterium]